VTTALYPSAAALPLFSETIVQSRISPGFTTVDLSSGTSAESRSTEPESCIFTSGRAALEKHEMFLREAGDTRYQ